MRSLSIEAGIRIAIVMPAYNAAKHITTVVERIPHHLWHYIADVWIINDGSTDTTRQVAESLVTKYGAVRTIHLAKNCGYGTAVTTGLRKCKESSCDFVVCLHADGQYPPESIPEFIDTMVRNGIDILQGSRIASGTALSGGMPFYKYCAGRILTFFENIIFNLTMTDYHSGFLVYSRKALDRVPFYRLSQSFDFDLEVIASARSSGLRIAEIPIQTRYADERSYLNPVTYGLRVVWVMVKYALGMYREKP